MSISDFYERYWQREDGPLADHGFAMAERQQKLQAALASIPPGSAILDAGCGNGEFGVFLAQLGYWVSGVDISESAVVRARSICPAGHFEVASLEHELPFADGTFQAIWCTEVLEHLFGVHATLAHLNRVLASGGLLIITVPYHGLIKNLAIALSGFERHYNPYLSHIRFYTRKSLCMCLRHAGFTVISWGGVGRRWPFWKSHFVVARKTSPPGPRPKIIG
ncbi:MAG: class I SAM-dependent methyltransferase [Chloroflexi bacterium]|nr:class I SAM-dependent methyltransferase [Chloroflexota bacterium]